MAPPLRIVRAGLEDLDAAAPLFVAYRRFYGHSGDAAAAREFLRERLAASDSALFLAWTDEHAVGFTQLYPLFSSIGLTRLWLLNDLFVAAAARRRGVATALLAAARRHARDTGARGLLLQTGTDNTAAQALYERSGWTRQGGFFWYELALP